MKNIISSILALVITLTSLPPVVMAKTVSIPTNREFNVEKDCPQGECAETLVGLIQAKTKLAQKDKCLPPNGVQNQQAWFEGRTFSMACYKLNREIEELISNLEKVEAHYKATLPENGGQCCNDDKRDTVGLNLKNLSDIDSANAEAMCTKEKQAAVWKKCGSDAMCVFISTASGIIPMGSSLANKMIPQSLKAQGCDPSKDDCMKQLALAFVKSVFNLFEGAWELLKMAGRGIKSGAKSVWGWVVGAEEQSSTAQLAAAGASEEEGVFKMLVNDFPGTMANLWTGLLGALKHWFANSMFCQEWAGRPQFSECKRPATGLDCLECKAMLTGVCSLTGAIVSEIIPAFLTGGLITAAKHGASAAGRLAKLFKVSDATSKAIKNSKIATLVSSKATTVSTAVRASKIGGATITALRASVKILSTFLVSIPFKMLKMSLSAMLRAASRSKTFIVLSPAGPVVSFGLKSLVNTGKVIIYPIENPMTIKAFQLGDKFTEKVFSSFGKANVVNGARPVLAAEAARSMGVVDNAYSEMQTTTYLSPGSKAALKAEEKYFDALRSHRSVIGKSYLDAGPGVPWDKLLDDLFPELNYGKYTKAVSEVDVMKAENELFSLIGNMTNKVDKDRLMEAYQKHTSQLARNQVVKSYPNYPREEVLKNAGLDDQARVTKAFETAGIDASKLSQEASEKMSRSILEAHNVGDNVVYNYSFSELSQKVKILKEAGFNPTQTDNLIRSGLAGKSRPEDAFNALRIVVVDEMKPAALQRMVRNESYGKILSELPSEKQTAVARALKVMEDGGMTPVEVSQVYRKFEKNFTQVQGMVDGKSDAASYLAEFIRKERRAGVADNVIQKKLDDAFRDCK